MWQSSPLGTLASSEPSPTQLLGRGIEGRPIFLSDRLQVLGGSETTACLLEWEGLPVPGYIIILPLGLTHSPTQLPLAFHTHTLTEVKASVIAKLILSYLDGLRAHTVSSPTGCEVGTPLTLLPPRLG